MPSVRLTRLSWDGSFGKFGAFMRVQKIDHHANGNTLSDMIAPYDNLEDLGTRIFAFSNQVGGRQIRYRVGRQ